MCSGRNEDREGPGRVLVFRESSLAHAHVNRRFVPHAHCMHIRPVCIAFTPLRGAAEQAAHTCHPRLSAVYVLLSLLLGSVN